MMFRKRSTVRNALLAAAAAVAVAGAALGMSAAPGSAHTVAAPRAAAQRVAVQGDLVVHDPALVAGRNGAPWYVYFTGDGAIGDGNIRIKQSTDDGRTWHDIGTVWDTKPAWVKAAVPKVDNLWAPEIYRHGDTYYLYYAASSFGSNDSVIGLATNTTLDPSSKSYKWVDRGPVMTSSTSDDFNAIDPAIVQGDDGTPYLAFGSFWSGIRMVKLSWPTGKRADQAVPLRIADRQSPPNAVEGAAIVPHAGRFYLIVSRDFCCRGVNSTYNMVVGRADSATGPYYDKNGVAMLDDGGTPLLASKGSEIGPGGASYSHGYLAWHFYDADHNGVPTLAIAKLGWGADGWPTLG